MIDISDPEAPSIVGSYDTKHDILGVYIQGFYAFVAYRGQGFRR